MEFLESFALFVLGITIVTCALAYLVIAIDESKDK